MEFLRNSTPVQSLGEQKEENPVQESRQGALMCWPVANTLAARFPGRPACAQLPYGQHAQGAARVLPSGRLKNARAWSAVLSRLDTAPPERAEKGYAFSTTDDRIGQDRSKDDYPPHELVNTAVGVVSKLAAGFDFMASLAEGLQVTDRRVSGRIVSVVRLVVSLQRIAPVPSFSAALAAIAVPLEGCFSSALPIAAVQIAIVPAPPSALVERHHRS
jgi:hypothetical protein